MSISSIALPLAASLTTQPGAATAPTTNSPQGTDAVGGIFLLSVLFFTFLAVRLTKRFGIFRGETILGPDRLSEPGNDGPLLLALFVTVCVWLASQTAYIGLKQSQWKAAGLHVEPAKVESMLGPRDMAFLSTVPPIIGFVLMLIIGRFMGPQWLPQLGLRVSKIGRGILVGLASFLVIGPLMFWSLIVLNQVYEAIGFKHPPEHVLLKSLGQAEQSNAAIFIALGATVCAPLFEELIFRGHLQTLLKHIVLKFSMPSRPIVNDLGLPPLAIDDATGRIVTPQLGRPILASWAAILLTSALFAMVHPMWMWPPIFVLSLGLGYVYERTGNLWANVTIHSLFNLFNTIQYLMMIRGH
jgi:membrane protease YdiL (CAAX protease family)